MRKCLQKALSAWRTLEKQVSFPGMLTENAYNYRGNSGLIRAGSLLGHESRSADGHSLQLSGVIMEQSSTSITGCGLIKHSDVINWIEMVPLARKTLIHGIFYYILGQASDLVSIAGEDYTPHPSSPSVFHLPYVSNILR